MAKAALGIGQLVSLEEGDRISIAVLLATLAMKPGTESSETVPEWFVNFMKTTVLDCLQLEAKILYSVLPLSLIGQNEPQIPNVLLEDTKLKYRLLSELLIFHLLQDKGYDARVRGLLCRVRKVFNISSTDFVELENEASGFLVKDALTGAKKTVSDNVKEDEILSDSEEAGQLNTTDKDKDKQKRNRKRMAKIGAAAVAGGLLIGITGGLAAPAIGAGLTALGGSLGVGGATVGVGSFLATTGGTAVAASLFGATGAGLNGYKMSRRIALTLKEFFFHEVKEDSNPNSATIIIQCVGWVKDKDELPVWLKQQHNSTEQNTTEQRTRESNSPKDVQVIQSSVKQDVVKPPSPPQGVNTRKYNSTHYSIVYARTELHNLYNTMQDVLVSQALNLTVTEALKHTALNTILAAVATPSLLYSLSGLLDNPWSVALDRAYLAGKELSLALTSEASGRRPVVLYGASLGSVVIVECLKQLRKKNVMDVVHSVYLLGAPVALSSKGWQNISTVVSGDFVNAYCPTDWLLSFLLRSSGSTNPIAGLSAIDAGQITNVDLSTSIDPSVKFHTQYSDDEIHQQFAQLVGLVPPVEQHSTFAVL